MSGLAFNTKTTLNTSKLKADINGTLKSAQAPLDSMVLADSNYFVPLKTGTLQKSAIINSRIGSGLIVWVTPYARRLYYEYEKPEHQINPNACSKWFEAAKARWLDKWVRLVNEYVYRK